MGNLEEFRKSLKLKPGPMAETLGLEYQAYYQYEKGLRKIPDDILQKLAGMGLNLNWLATGEGLMTVVSGTASATNQPDASQAQGQVGVVQSIPARVVYERQATRVVLDGLKAVGLEGVLSKQDEDWLIDQYADGLANGRSESALAARLDFLLRAILSIKRDTEPK